MLDSTRRVRIPTVQGPRHAESGDWIELGEEPSAAHVTALPLRRGERRGDETPVAGVPTVRPRGWQLEALGALL